MKTVWLVDDDASIRFVLEKALARAGFETESYANAQDVLNALKFSQPTVLVSDVRMPGMDGMALLETIAEQNPGLPVIIMTAHSDLDSAVNAFQKGAFEYLAKPFDLDEAVALVESACRANSTKKTKRKQAPQTNAHIIGEAPAMQEVFRAIGKLSASSMSVLINGESGTGKELVASALHNHSPRKENQFIALNMAAIPKELVESELFGHEKGAFTGADSIRKGRFEQANGGTLFLDEIGDMPLDVQTRLLRVLADGEFYRVGGHQSIKVDVRIIAATHQNLEDLVKQGKFRDDLFHRLNVVRLRLPALRERTEDIERLVQHFLHKSAKELQVESKILSPKATEQLRLFNWPGNVRQLENAVYRAIVHAETKTLEATDFAFLSPDMTFQIEDDPDEEILPLEVIERRYIEHVLDLCKGNLTQAAKKLGIGRATLYRKLPQGGSDD